MLCRQPAPLIESEIGEVEVLSSYGVEVRYQGETYYDIPKEDAQEAVGLAKGVKRAVLEHFKGKI